LKKLKNISTEERILEASKEVFMKYGLSGSRMRDIADAAHVNPALLHYYFRSKEKLFDKVFEGAMAKYFQQMDVFSDSSLPIKQRVLNYVDNIIDFYTEYPQMSMFIIKEVSINPDLFKQKVNVMKNAKVSLIGLLEEGIKKSEIKKIDTALFLINLQSLCSYPFLATPLFKHILKVNNKKDWNDFNTIKLKQAVKSFVENSLTK
jgi:AcrR family transcriptional regulator